MQFTKNMLKSAIKASNLLTIFVSQTFPQLLQGAGVEGRELQCLAETGRRDDSSVHRQPGDGGVRGLPH